MPSSFVQVAATGAALSRYPVTGTGDSSSRTIAMTDASNTTPIVVTAASHQLTTGNVVTISGVTGNTAANGTFQIVVLTTGTFELRRVPDNYPVAGNGTYGGAPTLTSLACLVDAAPSVAFNSATLTNASALGYTLEIISGTGAGQKRTVTFVVVAATTIAVDREWAVQPDATSVWRLYTSPAPIYLRSLAYGNTAAGGLAAVRDGAAGANLITLDAGVGASATWMAQVHEGIPFFDSIYVQTLTGTGPTLAIEYDRG